MQAINNTRLRGTAELEHRIVRPDGEVRFVRESTETFRDAEGRVVRMVGTCQDVTDQKAAEMAAEERSHFLEELLGGDSRTDPLQGCEPALCGLQRCLRDISGPFQGRDHRQDRLRDSPARAGPAFRC